MAGQKSPRKALLTGLVTGLGLGVVFPRLQRQGSMLSAIYSEKLPNDKRQAAIAFYDQLNKADPSAIHRIEQLSTADIEQMFRNGTPDQWRRTVPESKLKHIKENFHSFIKPQTPREKAIKIAKILGGAIGIIAGACVIAYIRHYWF